MSKTKRTLKNFFSLTSANFVNELLLVIAVTYLARVLGPAEFGKISFALAVISYFVLIANFGLDIFGTREIARDRVNLKSIVNNVSTLRFCLGTVSFVLLILLTALLNKPVETKYLIIVYGISIFPVVLLFEWVFQGVEEMVWVGISRIINGVVYLALTLLFIKNSSHLLRVPVFYTLAVLLSGSLLLLVFVKQFGGFKLEFNFGLWKKFFQQSLPIGSAIIMSAVYYNFSTIMLGMVRTETEIGYYNAAFKVIILFIGLIVAFYTVIFPLLSYYYKNSTETFSRLVSYTEKLMVTVGLPLSIGGMFIARPLISFLYGTNYDHAIIVLQIIIWLIFLLGVNSLYYRGLLAGDQQNYYFKIVVVMTVLSLILNTVFIWFWGAIGAAAAMVVTEFIGLFLQGYAFSRIGKINLQKYFMKPILASLVMIGVLYFIPNKNVFILILAGGISYGIIFYLLGGITKEEYVFVRNIFKKTY